jgi:hypothetical protein
MCRLALFEREPERQDFALTIFPRLLPLASSTFGGAAIKLAANVLIIKRKTTFL